MNVSYYDEKFPYLIIDEMFDPLEMDLIWEELDFLCYDDKLLDPIQGGSAEENGVILKNNKTIFLDETYTKPTFSNILSVNPKVQQLMLDVRMAERSNKDFSWYYSNLIVNDYNTMISYYENAEEYKSHIDEGFITALTWFYREPKKFTGGDLHFDSYDKTIEVKHNRTAIFPAFIRHSVDEVKMKNTDTGKKNGRWCMAQFFGFDGSKGFIK